MPLSDRESRVCDLIHAREHALLEELRLHVGLATGGGNAKALDVSREALTLRAKRLGAAIETVPGARRSEWRYGLNPRIDVPPVAICRRPGQGRELLIAGHLDTVHDPEGPFRELTIAQDGKTATGPGCVDMKGGLVIALAALEAIDEVGDKPSWTLLLNSDEETGSFASYQDIEDEAARVAKAGGLGIALEPATPDGGLVIQRGGSAQIMLESRGKAAHVGRDFASGVSAVETLCKAVVAAMQLSRPSDGVIVNFGPLEGTKTTNVVPDLARAWGNVRFPTEQAGEKLHKDLIQVAADLLHHPPPPQIVLHHHLNRPAKPLTPAVQQFADLVRTAAADLGQQLPFSSTAGVCDGNLMQAAGLPTLDTLGVRGGALHTLQEWIDLSSLVERCQLLALTIMRAGNA